MKKLFLVMLLIGSLQLSQAQQRYDYQLRLEPVWSRVADALGEPGSVESVEFSPDGKYLVSGTKFDNSVIMWRTSDGAELWRTTTEEEVERMGWSADGKYVAAASEDYVVTVYHSGSGEVFKVLKHSRGIDGLTWSHKGSLLATGKETSTIDFGNTVNELFFSTDDQYLLAVGHGSGKVGNLSKSLTIPEKR